MNNSATITDAPPSAAPSSMVASPDWITAYFAELRLHSEKARAAQAAGQSLPAVARRRFHDPAFAEEEAILLEAFADALESEAIHRCLAPIDPNAPKRRPFGSDSLLIRLLNIFHPKFSSFRALQTSLTRSTHPLNLRRSRNRPPLPDEDGTFKSRADLVAFRDWERQQAIALALDLLTDPSASASHSSNNPAPNVTHPHHPPAPAAQPLRSGGREATAIFPTPSDAHAPTTSPASTANSSTPKIPFNPEHPVNPVQKEHLPSAVATADSDASAPSDQSFSTEPTPPEPTPLWTDVQAAIAQHRAALKSLRRQGYSKNSQAVTTLLAHLAECESIKTQLLPHLPKNFLTSPDPPP